MKLYDLFEDMPSVFHEIQSGDWKFEARSVYSFLEKNGYTEIGEGGFSNVLISPDKRLVIKVTDKPDHCYEAFVDYIRNNPSPHFPRTTHTFRVDTNTYIVGMERLSELSGEARYDISKYRDEIAVYAEYDNAMSDTDGRFEEFVERNQSLMQALRGMYQSLKNIGGCMLDIKPANFMMRMDNTVVITDPVNPR